MSITCEIGTIEDVLTIDAKVTEFASVRTVQSIENRLQHNSPLILVAKVNGELAGYKIGYKLSESEFYSWLGAVAPNYRNLGVATKLMKLQETWVISFGYSVIRVKSMNCFSSMLHLLIASGYEIDGYEDNGSTETSKIKFVKQLV